MRKRRKAYLDSLKLKSTGLAVVTGGNSGVGKECARMLLLRGWKVILACRNLEKGKAAKEEFLTSIPGANVEVMKLDLASLDSIDAFVNEISSRGIDIDVFYNNAGIYRVPLSYLYGHTESQVGVNFISTFYLYQRIRPYLLSLSHPVKILFTSSIVARFVKFGTDDFDGGRKYDKVRAYKVSKLGVNIAYTKAIAESEGTNLIPILAHPGICYTPLMEKAYPGKTLSLLIKRFIRFFFNDAEKGAFPALFAMQETLSTHCLIGPRGLGHMAGYPKTYPLYQGNLGNSEEILLEASHRLKSR